MHSLSPPLDLTILLSSIFHLFSVPLSFLQNPSLNLPVFNPLRCPVPFFKLLSPFIYPFQSPLTSKAFRKVTLNFTSPRLSPDFCAPEPGKEAPSPRVYPIMTGSRHPWKGTAPLCSSSPFPGKPLSRSIQIGLTISIPFFTSSFSISRKKSFALRGLPSPKPDPFNARHRYCLYCAKPKQAFPEALRKGPLFLFLPSPSHVP